MKYLTSLIVLLHCSFFSIGQYVKQEIRPIGSIDSTEIVINEFETTHEILKFDLDTTNKNINFFLDPQRNAFGSVSYRKWPFVAFDYVNQKVRWAKQIDFHKERVVSKNDMYLYYDVENIYSLNPITGALDQEYNSLQFCHLDYHNDLILAYDTEGDKNEMLSAIDYSTGEVLWSDLVYRTAKYNYSCIYSDSLYVIDSKGLTFIDPYEGRLARLESGYSANRDKTKGGLHGSNSKLHSLSIMAKGLAFSISPTFSKSDWATINLDWSSSNILLVDNGLGYYCSKEYLYHFKVPSTEIIESYKGLLSFKPLLWKVKLPSNLTGKSTISISNDTLIMVNHGAKLNTHSREIISYELPYIALFNKDDGSLIDHTEIKNVRNIQEYEKINDKIIAISNLAIIEYDMNLKKITKGKNLVFKGSGSIEDFYCHEVYTRDSSALINVLENNDSLAVKTTSGKMLFLNKTFRKSEARDGKKYFTYFDEIDNTMILSNHKTVLLVDQRNNAIYGSFDLPDLNAIRGKFLISRSKTKLAFVDLNDYNIR